MLKMSPREQKMKTIRDLIDGKISVNDLDDKIEVFRKDGQEVAFKVNNEFVSREEWLLACLNNPKNPDHVGTIIVHSDEECYKGSTPDEYYV